MGKYNVKLEIVIDDDDITTPEGAAEDFFKRIVSAGNDWIYEVTDEETNKIYDVDFQGNEPETKEITEL